MFTLPCTHMYWAWQIIISILWSIIVSIVGYLQGLDSYNNYITNNSIWEVLLIPTMQSRDRCFLSVMYLMRSQTANCVSKRSEKKRGKYENANDGGVCATDCSVMASISAEIIPQILHLRQNIPREEQTWLTSKDPSVVNTEQNRPDCHKATLTHLHAKVPLQTWIYCSQCSDNESALTGGKVESLWSFEIIMMSKTVLILVFPQ